MLMFSYINLMDFRSREDLRVLGFCLKRVSFGDFKGEGEGSRSLSGGLYLLEGYFLRADGFCFQTSLQFQISSASNRSSKLLDSYVFCLFSTICTCYFKTLAFASLIGVKEKELSTVFLLIYFLGLGDLSYFSAVIFFNKSTCNPLFIIIVVVLTMTPISFI